MEGSPCSLTYGDNLLNKASKPLLFDKLPNRFEIAVGTRVVDIEFLLIRV